MGYAGRPQVAGIICLVFAALCIGTSAASHAQDLVIFDETSANGSPRGFYDVDPDTGGISLLTTVDSTSDRLSGFGYRRDDGKVYAGSEQGRIWRVDPTTGATSLVGSTGLRFIRGLTFSPLDGKLYGMGFGPKLYEINPDTAAVVDLGTVPDLDAGLAASADGLLYGQKDWPKDLLVIDPGTLETSTIGLGPTPPPISNFTFTSEGRLFGVHWQKGAVYEFDLASGHMSAVGTYAEHRDGMIGVFSIPEPVTLAAHLDIKPGSWPNPVNPKNKGMTPMAVLGTETFDVMSIDLDTLALSREGIGEEVAPVRWAFEDVGTPFDGEPGDGHSLTEDGLLDLALKFDTQEMIETLALIDMAGETVELEITGTLMDGTPFEATDWIRISAAPGGKSGEVRLVSSPAPGGTIVPEPATLSLLALGGLAVMRRRRIRIDTQGR